MLDSPDTEQHVQVAGKGMCAAIWRWPEKRGAFPTPAKILDDAKILRQIFGTELARAQGKFDLIETLRPLEPHVYLSAIGTVHPERCAGLASAVLDHGIDQVRLTQLPIFLDAYEPENIAFFRKRGFQPVAEHTLPFDGPMLTQMKFGGV